MKMSKKSKQIILAGEDYGVILTRALSKGFCVQPYFHDHCIFSGGSILNIIAVFFLLENFRICKCSSLKKSNV